MTGTARDIWVYLAASPLLHLTLTLVAYVLADWIFNKTGRTPVFNPVLIAVAVIVGFLVATGTSYETYFEGAQFVHFLLGPATVSLAIPLYRQFSRIRRSALAILVALLVGSITAIISAVAIAWLLGGGRDTMIALAPKSVTAPIAMGIAEKLGGLPSLTAVLVILTGILGAVLGTTVCRIVRVEDPQARGFALGLTSHGIGTARAFQIDELTGAFAAIAMGLNAVATAIFLPTLSRWLFGVV